MKHQSTSAAAPHSAGRAPMAGSPPTLAEARARRAERALLDTRPELSAGAPLWRWQKWTAFHIAVIASAGVALAPGETLTALFAALTVPFLCVVALRAIALWSLMREQAASAKATPPDDRGLPHYTVLVPIFREAEVVPDLVRALATLDYPASRLEVLLILEETDPETLEAVRRQTLPAHMALVVVPDGQPRTKPRALDYALQQATGDFVVIFDAEDVPEPGQLRAALATLQDPAHRYGCVQARLEIYNAGTSWLTRQFTIEYAVLFHALLPALSRLGLPVPLGGTSNHFPRAVLDEVGGWDPFNVTEDADLGIRLARAGYAVGVVRSSTSEEAPAGFHSWLRQRTRWLKGWMQTYLVHMRQPRRLWRELGPRQFFGLQVLMGGLLLSALVHPWIFFLVAGDLWLGLGLFAGTSSLGEALWWLGIVNLAAGYITAMALGAISARRCGRRELAKHALAMPIYWLAISLAAYRALFQLVTAPYLWEKTSHAPRSAMP